MIPQTRKYFVIVVHYGDFEQTRALLNTFLSADRVPDKTVVVDHGEKPFLYENYKDAVIVVRPEKNNGYAAGLLTGLGVLMNAEISENDIVICCNNDLTVAKDSLSRIASWWEGQDDFTVMGIAAGSVNLITGRTTINPAFPNGFFNMAYIHGSCFAAPLKVFVRARIPEQYFLYWEDVLLSCRAKRIGVKLKIYKKSGIGHNDEENKDMQPYQLYYLVRNGALFLERETPLWWRIYWFVLNRLRLFYHIFIGNKPIVIRALRDALKGVTGQKTLL